MDQEKFLNLPVWLQSNAFFRADLTNNYDEDRSEQSERNEVHPLDANLISSKKANGGHTLLLDIDMRNFVVDSSTGGHKHVYIDANLTTDDLKEVIDVLAKHGIVQPGIKKQLDADGFLSLRPPGVIKGTVDDFDLEDYKALLKAEKPKASIPKGKVTTQFKSFKESLIKAQKLPDDPTLESFVLNVTAEAWLSFLDHFQKQIGLEQLAIKTFEGTTTKGFAATTEESIAAGSLFIWTYDSISDTYFLNFYEQDYAMNLIDTPQLPSWAVLKTILHEVQKGFINE
jgi:hypothetical protein